jgi:hypothetical protein
MPSVRIRQALAVVFLVALCGATAANSAPSKVTAPSKASAFCTPGTIGGGPNPCTPAPLCSKGVKTTKAKPCNTIYEMTIVKQLLRNAALREVAPIQIDPSNIGERQGKGDAVTVITFLDIPAGKYRLSVNNTSGLGYINTFAWHPPVGMVITSITSSQGGKCSLVSGNINCRGGGKGIAPPKCTCEGGGVLTVDFTADGLKPTYNGQYWTYYGVGGADLQILTMTPVPYHIPSFKAAGVDLPLCRPGGPRPCSNT